MKDYFQKFMLLLLVCCFFVPLQNESYAGEMPLSEKKKDSGKTFDLVIYGKNLTIDHLNVLLRTNPIFGLQWEDPLQVSDKKAKVINPDSKNILVICDLSKERYFGQDIRENYIGVKLESNSKDHHLEISAMYAVNTDSECNKEAAEKYLRLIGNTPLKMKENAIASIVRPRSFILKPGKIYTEHIEAPVRHLKPGVKEVEWLDIIYGQ